MGVGVVAGAAVGAGVTEGTDAGALSTGAGIARFVIGAALVAEPVAPPDN